MVPEVRVGSGAPWSRGLRRSRSLLFELVRTGFAVFLAATLVFAIFQIWAGAPGLYLSPHDPKYEGVAAVDRQIFALDQPTGVRYGVWLVNVVTGNLGISFYYREPVTQVVATALPVTLELVLGSALWALLVGVLIGWASASRRHRSLGLASREAASVLYALPVVVVLVLLLIAIILWFPTNLAWPTSPGFTDGPPRVTGFLVLDSLLTGDLGLFGLAFGTTALITLPAGLAFAMPLAHRVRKALEERRSETEPHRRGFVAACLALGPPLAASLGVLSPFLLGAAMATEMVTGRRGIGLQLFLSVFELDGVLMQGIAILSCLVALAIGLPLALLGAGFGGSAPATAASPPPAPSWSIARVRRRLRAGTLVLPVGLVLLVAMIAFAALGPVLAPYGPLERVAPVGQPCTPQLDCPLSPPSSAHPLGVDFYGLDIFSQVLWGGAFILSALGTALAVAAGLGLALGVLPAALGRGADAVLRAALGALAALPVLVLVFLVAVYAGIGVAVVPLVVGLLFVPVVFRDVRDLAARSAEPIRIRGSGSLRFGTIEGRVEAALAAALPGFLARLPRRAAEMVLLLETLTVLRVASLGPVDWGGLIGQGLDSPILLRGDYAPLLLPAVLIILLVVGLVLASDGLRLAVEAPPPEAAAAPVQPPATPGDANP